MVCKVSYQEDGSFAVSKLEYEEYITEESSTEIVSKSSTEAMGEGSAETIAENSIEI